MALLCHPWITTTNRSYRFPILKLPPPPCAVLLVINHIVKEAPASSKQVRGTEYNEATLRPCHMQRARNWTCYANIQDVTQAVQTLGAFWCIVSLFLSRQRLSPLVKYFDVLWFAPATAVSLRLHFLSFPPLSPLDCLSDLSGLYMSLYLVIIVLVLPSCCFLLSHGSMAQ